MLHRARPRRYAATCLPKPVECYTDCKWVVARMNACALLAPPVSGNGSMADTNEAVQNPSEALFVTGRQVVLNDVGYVRAGVKLVPTVALAVAFQAGRRGFGLH